MKILRWLAIIIVIAGAGLSGRVLYLHAKAKLAEVLIRKAWAQSLRTGQPHAPWPWADTYPVARLQIPRLNYDEFVLEGATPRTLAFGPAHLLSGAAFGAPGNVIVAGHRTSWFRPLESVAQGDLVHVEWFDARRRLHQRTYIVDAIRIVPPQDVGPLAPTEDDVLTLITCYPFGPRPGSPLRYVVRADSLDAD